MESAGSAPSHPSPQAVLAKARDLYKSIGTQEAYDHAVQQRGLEALEADITAVISDICHLIASASEPQVRTDVVRQLVQLLSIKRLDGTIEQKAIDAGVLPALVEQLSGCEEVQRQAALALGELAITHGDLVVDAGAVPPLVQLVSSADDNVRGAAIAALCIITTESSTCRDAVLAAGVLQPLLKAMRESSVIRVLHLGARLLGILLSVSENSPPPLSHWPSWPPSCPSWSVSSPSRSRTSSCCNLQKGPSDTLGRSVPGLVLRLAVPMLIVRRWSSVAPWPRSSDSCSRQPNRE